MLNDWTDDDLKFVIENQPTMTYQEIAYELNKTDSQVGQAVGSLIREGILFPKRITAKKLKDNGLMIENIKLHDVKIGDKYLLKSTEKSVLPATTHEGKVIFNDGKILTIKTKHYPVSVSAVDIAIGEWKIQRRM